MAYALLDLVPAPVSGRTRGPVLRVRHPVSARLIVMSGAGFRDQDDAQVARAIQPVGPDDRDWRLFPSRP